jgi:osmotically inducible protein OsmC
MTKIETVLLTGKTHTTLNGSNGLLNLELSAPGNDKHPKHSFVAVEPHPTAEQLFAGAWSACFITALGLAAKEKKVVLSPDLALDIEADLGMTGGGYFLQIRIDVSLPGLERELAEAIVHAADAMCPYSKATRGNIDVVITLV